MKYRYILLVVFILGIASCLTHQYLDHSFRQTYSDHRDLLIIDSLAAPYLKLHYKDGDVILMETWEVNEGKDSIRGMASRYDFNRNLLSKGDLTIPIENIVLIESNRLDQVKDRTKGSIGHLNALAAVDAAIGALCLLVPKACFGSCPTFYVKGQEALNQCKAEGFSHAIMPSLKDTDVDAMNYSSSESRVSIVMKNEALETHVVDEVKLIAVARNRDNQHAYEDGEGRYFICNEEVSPSLLVTTSSGLESNGCWKKILLLFIKCCDWIKNTGKN